MSDPIEGAPEGRAWQLARQRVRIYPDGPLRSVTGRPVGRATLCGVEVDVRRASYRDLQLVAELLGEPLEQAIKRGLTTAEHARIAVLACVPCEVGTTLPADVLDWPVAEYGLVQEIVGLFLGQGRLELSAP